MSDPDVSVVIATYNRRERLLRCLERLAAQTLPRERFEVVVASDGSSDGTVEAARAAGERLGLALTAIEAPHGGPGSARNHGVARARGKIIAFADDDVEVEPGWLEAGLAAFTGSDVAGVEGRTEPVLGDESLFRGNVINPTGGIYPTCNIFYRRDVFERVGGFDPLFRTSREDSDLAYRVLDLGQEIPFAPAALARHRSHQSSVLRPLHDARTLVESIHLRARHPRRDVLLDLWRVSDLVKMALALGGVAALALGWPWLGAAALAGFAALVVRTMSQEVVWRRALRADRLPALLLVYALLPFANTFYKLLGLLRVCAGGGSAEAGRRPGGEQPPSGNDG